MSPIKTVVVAALFGLLSEPVGASSLTTQMADDGWVSWTEPMIARTGDGPCCFEMRGNDMSKRGCRLVAGKGQVELGKPDANDLAAESPFAEGLKNGLVVYALRAQGKTVQLHALAADCPVQLDSPALRLRGVASADSLDWLDEQVDLGSRSELRQSALMTMAYHDHSDATERLIKRSAPEQELAVRRDALFWLGQLRGEAGLPVIQRTALSDDNDEIRHHALFVLAQSDLAAAEAILRQVAMDADQADETRGQALFWMAQSDKPGARQLIERVLRSAAAQQLQEQAVFALSQLQGEGDAALIAIIEGKYPREAKRRALFWLGQSGSEQALRFLDRYLAER